jgi:hypothetical protein
MRLSNLARNEQETKDSRFQSTIGELASQSHFIGYRNGEQWYSGNNPAAREAAYIQDTTANLRKYVSQHGTDSYSRGWGDTIDQMQKNLADAGYIQQDHTLQAIHDSIREAATSLANLDQRASSTGIIIQPTNGN